MSFDFDAAVAAPFRMQPGLRRLAPGARQLSPAGPGSRHQREKLAVLSAFADDALQAASGFDASPALQALAAHAAAEHPHHWQWDGHTATALGVAVRASDVQRLASGSFGLGDEISRCLAGLPAPWRLAGLLSLAFEEDFAIVDAAGPGPATLAWLAVALPSHWAPREKCGLPFAEAHAPVADNALLMQAAQALMRLVTGAQRWERFVWNVTAHPRLHAHPDHVDSQRWQGRFDPAQAWWRTEHQTFIPLPALQQAIFTIGVQVQPLAQALQPGQAAQLQAAVASMSPAVLDYRGLTAVRGPLLDWLQARAAG
jgi:dimethylamine monooxygenase subunit A